MKNIITFIVNLLIIFGFLFDIAVFGPLSSRRIAVIWAIIYMVINRNEVRAIWACVYSRRFTTFLILFTFCAFIAFWNNSGAKSPTNEYLEPWYFLYQILYIPVFALFVVTAFKDAYSFCKVYLAAFYIQAVAVILSVVNYGVRIFMYTHFYRGDDRFENTIETGKRIMGIGLDSSSGSIICSTACMLLVYLKVKSNISNFFFYFSYFIVVLTTLFIGRTGVVVEFALLLLMLILDSNSKRSLFMVALLAAVVPFSLSYILSFIDSGMASTLLDWITGVLSEESRENTISGIMIQFPRFSEEMIFGTGISRGVIPGGEVIEVDSGFIKTYCAIGIVGALLYYLAFLKLYQLPVRQIMSRSVKIFFSACILLSFIIEVKEPFMLKYIFPWMILTLLMFQSKDTDNSQIQLSNI